MITIGTRAIDVDTPPYVIAEIGVNHDGQVDRALALVDAAFQAKADAIKLQLFETNRLLSRAARLADYQAAAGMPDPFDMLRRLELTIEEMRAVTERAHERGLHAIVTIFSLELIADAETVAFDAYKTASTDLVNRPLIDALCVTGKPLLVSTGAATLQEVATSVAWLGPHPHLIFQCVSQYPTPDDDAALGGRSALAAIDAAALGYSDHTTSVDTGALAVASGATILEKHLTHDHEATGPDHAASLDARAFTTYVELAHRAWRMRGSREKSLARGEEDVRQVSRQSVTTTQALRRGATLSRDDLTLKRPGVGLPPASIEMLPGRTLARAVDADVPLTEDDLL